MQTLQGMCSVVVILLISAVGATPLHAAPVTTAVYPGTQWVFKTPAEVGMDAARVEALTTYASRGCIVRYGYLIKCWQGSNTLYGGGSISKPVLTHLLLKAEEEGKLSSVENFVNVFEPRLNPLNADLGYKDRQMRWQHMARQFSGYSMTDVPGTAFDYNDYNMALFGDTLLLKVYGAGTWDKVNSTVVWPKLTNPLQCQDAPAYDSNGRFLISMRDYARIGLLYLRQGTWKSTQLLSRTRVQLATTNPFPSVFPNSQEIPAEMIPGQRSFGNFTGGSNPGIEHKGSYSYTWWTNGIKQDGSRRLPDAPLDVFYAQGWSAGDTRGQQMFVIPSLEIVVTFISASVLDTGVNAFLKALVSAVTSNPVPTNTPPVVDAGPTLRVTLPASATLNGTVTDDGRPNPPAAVTTTWSKVYGPGTVTFGNAAAVDTTASFSSAGTYALRLRANDGALAAIDDVTVTVTTSAQQAVVSFTLINADTDQPIATFNPFNSGTTVALSTLPTRNLNVRANTTPAVVGSVRFGLDGNANFRTESGAPYALAGDTSGNYAAWTPSVGSHTLTATPYTGAQASGAVGTPLTITFAVTN